MTTARPVPPLEAGDRLTRAEFERRYAAMPHVKKAELVEGVVYMPSPVSQEGHGEPHTRVVGWLYAYRRRTPGVESGDNSTVLLDGENEMQPDALLRILPGCGGQTRTVRGYVVGAPELVVEIAASSASYDLHDKLRAYRRNGVREYVVLRTIEGAVDWFVLREGVYETLPHDDIGRIRSQTFPGLWLDVLGMLRGDPEAILSAVETGCTSPEHAAFVQRLARAAGSQPS